MLNDEQEKIFWLAIKHKNSFYWVWHNMKERCNNDKLPSYKDYGGRGIKLTKRWYAYTNFEADMYFSFLEAKIKLGEKRGDVTIDRRNNNAGYSKNNCRWVTIKVNDNNRRPRTGTRFLEHNGQSYSVADWARLLGVGASTLSFRLNNMNWDVAKTLETPIRKIQV